MAPCREMTSFRFPNGVRYSCLRCGDGCRTFNVPLGPGERDTLKKLDWAGKEEHLDGAPPAQRLAPPGQEARWCLRRRNDGACIYLDDDNLCLIHKHFGAEAKPLMCRLYPFGFYPMGGEIGVDVAFTCRAVSRGHGNPVEEAEPEWSRLLHEAGGKAEDKQKHEIRPGVDLPGSIVWELEHCMLGFLNNETLKLFDRIRAVLLFLRIGTTGDPTADTARPLREAMTKGIPVQIIRKRVDSQMDKTQRAIFYQWLFLCLNPPPHQVHGMPQNELEIEKARRLKAGQRYLKRRGKPWIDDREINADFKAIARVDGDILKRADTAALIVVYLQAKILGQRFLIAAGDELPFVEAAQKFFIVVPMIIWTAKALAADRGASRAEVDDVRGAIRLVDRTLGTLPTSALPKKQAEACDFIMLETDFVEAAIADLLAGR